MIQIELAIEAGDWPGEKPLNDLCTKAIAAAQSVANCALPRDAEISFLFTDDSHMQSLNNKWRGKDRPTNVLSFAASEGDGPVTGILGDIVLAFETIEREAAEQSKSFDNHLSHLVIHGYLHVMGFDHEDKSEAERMETMERKALAAIGIADPYAQ